MRAKWLELPGSRAPRLGSTATVVPRLFAPLHVGSSGPGIEPVFPALVGGFLSIAPSGKS